MSRFLRWSRTSLVVLLLAVLVAGLVGGVVSFVLTRRGFNRYPRPGRLVEVGDHRLHLHCTGQGPATVVFESAIGGWSIDWALVQRQLPSSIRACSYDRAGYGWSDPSHRRYQPEGVARELHELLDNAGIRGPYILVGHSIGGIYVRQFAHLYSSDIAGLLFVDSSHEQMNRRLPQDSDAVRQIGLLKFLRVLRFGAITGFPRLVDMPVANLPELRGEQREIAEAIGYRYADYDAFYNEAAAFVTAGKDERFVPPSLPDVPLTVLTARQNLEHPQHGRVWAELQAEVAGLSSDSKMREINSGHFIQVENPGAVVSAILDLINRAGTKKR